ncbi:MAG: glycosyltransferase family 2 protein [Patescibacteria group bacterium]|jgi:hypothetical protein
MYISICILNYNGKKFIDACLGSIRNLHFPEGQYEVVFADNASSDDSVDWVRTHYPEARIVVHPKNYGFAKGNNLAVKECRGDYVFFLNNDTAVDPNCLSALAQAVKQYPDADFFGSKLLIQAQPDHLNSAGITHTIIGAGYDRGFGRLDTEEYEKNALVGGVSGAAMLVKKQRFADLGMFDDDYFMYFEDVDLCLRNLLLGGKSVFVSRSIVYHAVGGSAGGHRNNFRLYYGTRNRLTTLVKNFPIGGIIVGFVVSVLFDLTVMVAALLRGNFKAPWTILRAYAGFMVSLRAALSKRRMVQIRRSVSMAELKRQHLVVDLIQSVREYYKLRHA